MNGRDAFSEELLSAYLDGDLSAEQCRYVERMLGESSELHAKYRSLVALNDQLRGLARYELSGQAASRIADAIAEASLAVATDSDPDQASEALLSAYLDGELNAIERAMVERQCDGDESRRRLVEELRDLSEQFAALPFYRLDDGFADRVLRQLESVRPAMPADEDSGTDLVTVAACASGRRSAAGGLRGVIWAAAAIATAVMLMLFAQGPGDRREGQFVQSDPGRPQQELGGSGSNPTIRQRGPAEWENQLAASPGASQVPQPSPSNVATTFKSPFTMVSSLSRTKLVLVYEIAVTEQGVQNAAFANLLRRHRIGFDKTLPIGREEQEDLLAHRCLDNVQVAGQQREQMDRVDLYLVSTTGLAADAMYMDLMSRPEGIGAFALNLTTRDAQDRVLNRLCESSGVENNVGQAVRLLANFGMLSSTARAAGAFGAIRWVDPALYEPPTEAAQKTGESLPVEERGVGGQVAQGGAVQKPGPGPGDFSCELLFVVRQWGVTPDAPSAGGGGS